ncbi:hypothetical protein [Nigerium massiliense]|uniref:hypothetical protein n=1 Tax=Nigerium massiliense TaxID=1522317 RepID=UPI00058D8A60|nr:hypothetical protein [Nigerium massiliense]
MPSIVAELSPPDETGIATGVYNSLRTLGGSVAGAVFGVILTSFAIQGTTAVAQAGYVTVWLVCASLWALALLLVISRRRAITAKLIQAGKSEPAGDRS